MLDARRKLLAERVRRSAHELLSLAAELEREEGEIPLHEYLVISDFDTSRRNTHAFHSKLELAEYLYKGRGIRESFLPKDLLGEPAWDLLLDLYISEKKQRSIQITSACIASRVPPTTALRWIGELTEMGYVRRIESEIDRRRAFLRLTPLGMSKMEEYLAALLKLTAGQGAFLSLHAAKAV